MKSIYTYTRNKITGSLYKAILKPLFFRHDPEKIHDYMTVIGSILGKHVLLQKLTSFIFNYKNPSLEQNILGITFKNPVGLSAGFDKNAQLTDILPSVGFGFVEVGSITGEPCQGNPKPRLWRMPRSKGLVVYYGLKNDGCEAIFSRLTHKKFKIPLGTSVAMTNCIENMDDTRAIHDFAKAFKTMEPVADYITVNISCPNTQSGQPFIDPKKLDALFTHLDTIPTQKPVFIKLSADLTDLEIDNILTVVKKHRIHGIITTNLTKNRNNPQIQDPIPHVGGMSGKVVQDHSDHILSYIYKRIDKNIILIGSGGIFNARDAYKKIRLGASLVQIITGMVFEGPQIISEINRGLAEYIQRDGFKNVSEVIGIDNK